MIEDPRENETVHLKGLILTKNLHIALPQKTEKDQLRHVRTYSGLDSGVRLDMSSDVGTTNRTDRERERKTKGKKGSES